jgi:hypothetical protein
VSSLVARTIAFQESTVIGEPDCLIGLDKKARPQGHALVEGDETPCSPPERTWIQVDAALNKALRVTEYGTVQCHPWPLPLTFEEYGVKSLLKTKIHHKNS